MATDITIRSLSRTPIRIGTKRINPKTNVTVDLDDVHVRTDLRKYMDQIIVVPTAGGGGMERVASESDTGEETYVMANDPIPLLTLADVEGDEDRDMRIELNIPYCYADEARNLLFQASDGTDSYVIAHIGLDTTNAQFLGHVDVPAYSGEKDWVVSVDGTSGAEFTRSYQNASGDTTITVSAFLL